jgi:acyl-CoA thioesterase
VETISDFDRGTAVEPLGPNRFRGLPEPRWNIGNAPNGGYLVTIALSALSDGLPHPDPVAVSAHFATRTESGAPLQVEVEPVRAGKSHSTAVAWLRQEGTTRVHVTATYGDLEAMTGPTNIQSERPAFPPPDQCVPAEGPALPSFIRQFDLRLLPETAMWAVGRPSGRAEMAGWIRLKDGRRPDPHSLVMFADSFPPTVFNLFTAKWVPTLELTVHVRGRPAPGWVQCRFQTRYLINGYLEEDGEIWDETGTLVALSRQLARIQA